MAGKYLYGVVKRNALPEDLLAGVAHDDGRKFYMVPYGDIACAVSDSNGIDVHTAGKDALLRHLAGYQTVMEAIISKQGTVIPIKFETVLRTDEEVERMLESGYEEFFKRLERFDGKVEVDITARWAEVNGLIKKIGEEDDEIRRLKIDIAGRPAEKTMDDRVRLGYMVKKALDRKRNEAADAILEKLRSTAFDFRAQEPRGDDEIFVSAFLLDSEKEGAFYDAVRNLNEGFKEDVCFRCVSPLPPYAFTTMSVEKIGNDEIERAQEILGLDGKRTPEEIKLSFRSKVLECHPDKKASASADGFAELKKAYEVLKSRSAAAGCSYGLGADGGEFFVREIKV